MRLERTPAPCAVVIFGASGDLTRRKLMPALYSLFREHLLPTGFSVVGVARTEMTDDEFRDAMREAIEEFGGHGRLDADVWSSFAEGLFYLPAHPGESETYGKVSTVLGHLDRERGTAGN